MSSLHIHYEYANGTSNTIRPTSVTYPDGRVLTYDYGTSGEMNDKLSRVESLGFDGTGNLVQPAYLGLGTQVKTTYSEPQVRWDLATGSSPNPYAGLDRFGRVIDNKWTNYSTTATLDQIKYTYDRASNRVSRENVVAKAQATSKYFDEYYQYDDSNRLTEMQRGQLSGSPPTGVTNKQFAQDWGLDPTGNWKVFKEDANGDGTWDLNQTRTSNPVNEITAINETAGPSWVTPGYDSAGNMTTIPRPAEPTGEFTGIYDAWNRLVELRGLDDTVVGRYEYDGLTRRVVKHTFPGWEELEAADWDAMTEEYWNGLQLTQAHRRDYYYDASWQILEERVENDTAFDRQYVWGLRYIDGLVFRDRQLTSSVERNYALQDANWNVTALTDDTGAVVERYSYSAYGVPNFLNPDFTAAANTEAYDWDVLYAGYKWDSESELYQVRYRYLQPAIGGWVSRDLIDTLYLYRYSQINPLSFLDPLGLKELRVYVYSSTEFPYTTYEEAAKPYDLVIDSSNFGDIIKGLRDLSKSNPLDCIKNIVILGHGDAYGIYIGQRYVIDPKTGNRVKVQNDQGEWVEKRIPGIEKSTLKDTIIGSDNFKFVASELNKGVNFCDAPTIYLMACNTGTSKKTDEQKLGTSWVQQFADMINKESARIAGTLGYIYTEGVDPLIGPTQTFHKQTVYPKETHDFEGKPYPGVFDANGKLIGKTTGPYAETDYHYGSQDKKDGVVFFTKSK